MHDRDSLAAELTTRLGGRPREPLMDYLDRQGFLDDVSNGASTIDDLERQAREVIAVTAEPLDRSAPDTAPKRTRKAGTGRMLALSELVAQHARRDPDVVRF